MERNYKLFYDSHIKTLEHLNALCLFLHAIKKIENKVCKSSDFASFFYL